MRIGIDADERWFGGDAEKMFSVLHEVGYGALDLYLGPSYYALKDAEREEFCKKYKALSEKYDVVISQTHAPFLINAPDEEFLSDEFFDKVLASVYGSASLGVKYLVVHPNCPQGLDFFVNARTYDYGKLIDHNKEVNLKYFERFVPHLKKTGVMICIENLFAYDIILQRHVLGVCGDPDETNFYIDALGEDCFGACYDSGHLNHFAGDEAQFIRKLGKRLKVLHLNDSFGKDFHGMDWHLMPGQGDVSWDVIAATLKETGYEGVANFEVSPRKGIFFMPQLKYIYEIGNLIFNK